MLSRNLTYYRLKKGMSKKALAEGVHVSPAMITYYETNQRKPSMDRLKLLASCLGVGISDLLRPTPRLQVDHGEFRKLQRLNAGDQKLVRMMVEDYLGRLFDAFESLPPELRNAGLLPEPPAVDKIPLSDDVEADARAMRAALHIPPRGPVPNLVETLESQGFLMVPIDFERTNSRTSGFSGINGYVNGRPYIAFNANHNGERNRSTIAHELAHLLFDWSGWTDERALETEATAIGGAFLFPREDVFQELGNEISLKGLLDKEDVAEEYGISMMLLGMRAHIFGIVSDANYRRFCIEANRRGWRSNEESRIDPERPQLLFRLVREGVGEGIYSAQRGAELLGDEASEVSDISTRFDAVDACGA